MKKILFFFFLLALIGCRVNLKVSKNDLYGTWVCKNFDQTGAVNAVSCIANYELRITKDTIYVINPAKGLLGNILRGNSNTYNTTFPIMEWTMAGNPDGATKSTFPEGYKVTVKNENSTSLVFEFYKHFDSNKILYKKEDVHLIMSKKEN